MRTLTLKINDDYFDKIVSFLEILPKKAVKIEKEQINLNDFQRNIKNAMTDIKTGKSKVLRVVNWKNYIS